MQTDTYVDACWVLLSASCEFVVIVTGNTPDQSLWFI